MQLEFRNIDVGDVAAFVEHWSFTDQHASDYSFPILLGWAFDYGYQVFEEKSTDLLWIRQTKPSLYNLAPIGGWHRGDWKQLIKEHYGSSAEFWLVPERLVDIWRYQFGAALEIEEDRGNWEYLYDIKSLATLSGNKYMKKRNRVNQFSRTYNYAYEEISRENAAEVMDFQQSWCQANNCGSTPGLVQESHGIQRILQSWDSIPDLRGGLLRVDGNIAAYTIGELAGDTVLVHFEKASLEYGAGYQVINKEFLSHMLDEDPDLVTVNREEDMNDPGLREAKMSYLPKGFIKKFHVKMSL